MQNNEYSLNGVLFCQQNRTQVLNDRIFSRNNPYFHQPPRYDPRSIVTKRTRFPIITSNNVCDKHSKKNGFNVDNANNFYEAINKITSPEKKLISCIGSLYNVGNILNKN